MPQVSKDVKPTKLNILYFGHHSSFTGIGGGARVLHMLTILEKFQISTQLISYLPDEKLAVKCERRNDYINVTTVHVPRRLPKILKLAFLPLLLLYGLRYIGRSNIVFSHGPSIVYGPPALVLAKIFRKPLLVDHPDIRDPDTPRSIYTRVLKNSDILFVISRYLEDEARRLGCRRVIYLPIFVDTDIFKKDDLERLRTRTDLDIAEREIVIGYAGSFSKIEGVPYLLKAFKNLSAKYDNIRLVIIGGRNVTGSDDLAGMVSELALDNRTVLVPPQPHELMPRYLSIFDIACSPKIDCAENRAANPIKIYEYMSMGLPTVISAVGEPANVIENGIDGFLVKPGDINDLERTLDHVIQNLESAKEVGQRAREKVIASYTFEVFQERIKDALTSLSEGRR